MSSYRKDISRLSHPENIEGTEFTESLYALARAFRRDPAVCRLLCGGPSVAFLLARELLRHGPMLQEMSRTCFAWILSQLDPELASEILAPLFVRSMQRPTLLFTHLAAHVLREHFELPVRSGALFYSASELREILSFVPVEAANIGKLEDGHTLDAAVGWFGTLVRGIRTAAGRELISVLTREREGIELRNGFQDCYYAKFSQRQPFDRLGPTYRYNCFGFVFVGRRFAIGSCHDASSLLCDNCRLVIGDSEDPIRPGDIAVYQLNQFEIPQHAARVWQVDPTGHPTMFRAKLGAAYQEATRHRDEEYQLNTHKVYYRQLAPLQGIADVWIRSHELDNGEQYSVDVYWESPDILVSVGPFPDPRVVRDPDWDRYSGIFLGDPECKGYLKYGQELRIWAKVRNRGTVHIATAYVRYFWADASTDLGPGNWHPIKARDGAEYVKVFNLAPGDCRDAPWVRWRYEPESGSPIPLGAHICLMAIAYVGRPGDDQTDRDRFHDQVVYPFDPAWDNNIAMRNVIVVHADVGDVVSLSLGTREPRKCEKIQGSIEALLTQIPQSPHVALPSETVPLQVVLSMDGRGGPLVPISEHLEKGVIFKPDDFRGLARPIGGVVLPYESLGGPARHKLDLKIRVPRNARPSSLYYLRIAQNVSGRITGGCTVVIRVTK